jgi:hypothetical protein
MIPGGMDLGIYILKSTSITIGTKVERMQPRLGLLYPCRHFLCVTKIRREPFTTTCVLALLNKEDDFADFDALHKVAPIFYLIYSK